MWLAIAFRRAAVVTLALGLLPGCGGDPEFQTANEAGGKLKPLPLSSGLQTPSAGGNLPSLPLGGLPEPAFGSASSSRPPVVDQRVLIDLGNSPSIRDSLLAMETELSRSGLSNKGLQKIPDLSRTLGARGNPDYEAELNRGAKFLEQKKLDEALAAFEAAQKLEPGDHRAFLAAAVGHAQRGQTLADATAQRREMDLALAEIGVAIRTAPDNDQLYLQRGHIHAAMRRDSEAVADFSRYLEAHPDAADVLIARGMAALNQRQPLITIADADKLHKLHPQLPDAMLLRAMGNFVMFIVRMGENQRDSAANYRRKAQLDFDESVKLGLEPSVAAHYRKVFYPE